MNVRHFALASVLALAACGIPESQSQEDVLSLSEELRAANRSLEVSVALVNGTIDAATPVLVDVTVRNVGRKSVSLLNYFAPGAEIEEPLFAVTRDGQPVEYVGRHYKRPQTSAADFATIAAGGVLSYRMDLSDSYDFSLSGSYAIQYDVNTKNLHGLGSPEVFSLKSNVTRGEITGRVQGKRPGGGVTVGNVTMTRCDTTQQNQVLSAVSSAKTYATQSRSYLAGNPSATARYTTWFGAFSTSGWNTASQHFVAIEDAFYNKAITVNCGCNQSYYAYVYPNRPYEITVCRAFWSAPMTGTDSKAGTMIHEMSHFDVVAGTDDWAYGQTNAKALASSDPTKALNNADNHEYFAENTPFLQ